MKKCIRSIVFVTFSLVVLSFFCSCEHDPLPIPSTGEYIRPLTENNAEKANQPPAAKGNKPDEKAALLAANSDKKPH